MNDDINEMFRDGAQLVMYNNTAYIEVGLSRYYFTGEPEKRTVELFDGSTAEQTILPYDGWEKQVVL